VTSVAAALDELAEEQGLQVTGSAAFPPAATDVTAQLSAVAAGDPDVILVWAVNPANAIVAKNAQALSLDAVVFQAPGAASAAYLQLGGAAAGSALVQASKVLVPDSIPEDDPQHDVVTGFAEAYQAEYGSPASQFGGGAFDAALLMATALEKGDVDPCAALQTGRDALHDALQTNIEAVPGTIAVYTFDEDQHGPSGIEGLAVLEVQGGRFTLASG
jgi:branched-chain amino acid transport system substrate-binding protein